MTPGSAARIPVFAFATATAVAVATTLALGCGGEQAGPAKQGPPPPSVEVMEASLRPFVETADLVGELRAVESVEIQSEVAGVVASIEFEEGQAVDQGAILIRLHDEEQRARLHEAEARVILADHEFDRTQSLASRNAAAAAQLDRRRAELAMANAQLELSRVELERTRIRAPFAGHLGPRLVSPGARIEPDDSLVRLETLDPIDLATTVAEWAIPLVKMNAELQFQVQAYPNRTFTAVLDFISPSVSPAIRRVPIKARAENPEGLLRPGMFVDVTVELERRDAILLPEEAVMNDQTGSFVWRITPEDTVERVPVEVGSRDGQLVEIRSGLTPGERIVSAGTHKVRPGDVVTAVAVGDAGTTAARPDLGGGA